MGNEALVRNLGLFSKDEQEILQRCTILIAGAGGIGGRVAETFARMGIGTLLLADPDTFSESNLNRQAGSSYQTLGRNKAEVLADLCANVGNRPNVITFSDGVTPENLETLFAEVDLVVDATDYTLPEIGLMIARTARQKQVPLIMAVEIAFGTWLTVVEPLKGTYEQLLGLPQNTTYQDLISKKVTVPFWRWVGVLPKYANTNVLKLVSKEEIPAPAIAPAVEVAAGFLSTMGVELMLGRKSRAIAPKVCHVDARLMRLKTYRPRYWKFVLSALVATFLTRRKSE